MDEQNELRREIIDYMKQAAYRPISADELGRDLRTPDKRIFTEVLEQLEREGRVIQTRKMKYGLPEQMNLAVGRLQGHANGFGFLIQDEQGTQDIFISPDNMNSAMHNDRVVVRLLGRGWNGSKPEGEIIRILDRANRQ